MKDLLYRILSRKIILNVGGLEYTIKAPDVELKYRAELYKKELYKKYRFELPTLESFNTFLKINRFIDNDFETKIKNMNEALKKFKVELYLAGPKIESQKQIRKNIKEMREKLNKYYADLESYQRNSLDFFVDSLKNKFILINTTYLNDKLILDNNNLDLELMNRLITVLNNQDISASDFRDLAISEEWRGYYLNNKYNLFGIPSVDYSEEQKILCGYSRMYQNAFDHPECPDEEVMKDHDRFDGWMIIEQKKVKSDKKQQVTNIDPKYQEVFVMAANEEEAASIYNANSQDGKRILKERAKVLNSTDTIKDKQFKDVRLDILASSSSAQSEHIKNIGK